MKKLDPAEARKVLEQAQRIIPAKETSATTRAGVSTFFQMTKKEPKK